MHRTIILSFKRKLSILQKQKKSNKTPDHQSVFHNYFFFKKKILSDKTREHQSVLSVRKIQSLIK